MSKVQIEWDTEQPWTSLKVTQDGKLVGYLQHIRLDLTESQYLWYVESGSPWTKTKKKVRDFMSWALPKKDDTEV